MREFEIEDTGCVVIVSGYIFIEYPFWFISIWIHNDFRSCDDCMSCLVEVGVKQFGELKLKLSSAETSCFRSLPLFETRDVGRVFVSLSVARLARSDLSVRLRLTLILILINLVFGG